MISIRKAAERDIDHVIKIAHQYRDELGYVIPSALRASAVDGRILVAVDGEEIVGFLHFRHCLDGHTTVYEIAVSRERRLLGIGKRLIEELVKISVAARQDSIRLKCPIDLEANEFYQKIGFKKIGTEHGKRRPLNIWERRLRGVHSVDRPLFFLSMTSDAGSARKLVTLWEDSGDSRNPLENVIITPAFARKSTMALVKEWHDRLGTRVMFDSGGYQVQSGRLSHAELCSILVDVYASLDWGQWYILPDHVPKSSDDSETVERKVEDTIRFGLEFVNAFPPEFRKKALGVAHGRTFPQIERCVRAFHDMGLQYVGFGSFGTSGPNGSVNMVSRNSIALLTRLQGLTDSFGMRVHIFGMGSPNSLMRIYDAGIRPTSFDSSAWLKSGGFGFIFFPFGSQIHLSKMSEEDAIRKIEDEKARSGHVCANFVMNRKSCSLTGGLGSFTILSLRLMS